MGHYTLDVDIASLTAVQAALGTMAEHLATHAQRISGAPGDLGSTWTGAAATAVTTEMTGLGAQCQQFSPTFTEAAQAISVFVVAAQTAQESIDQLNRQHDQAEQDCGDAIAAAERNRDNTIDGLSAADTAGRQEASDAYGITRGRAADTLRWTLKGIAAGHQETIATLQAAGAALGAALRDATVVPVSDETVSSYQRGGLPLLAVQAQVRRDALVAMTGQLDLPQDAQAWTDGERAAADFPDVTEIDTGEVQAYLDGLDVYSEAFRQGFLQGLDPQALIFMQRISHMGVSGEDGERYGQVVTAVSQMLALGSNDRYQSMYSVSTSVYDGLRDTYRAADVPPGEGYLLLAEIVQAGQGSGALWDSALLTEITEETIAFERRMQAENEVWSWGSVFGQGNGTWPTEAGRGLVGDAPGRADALAMLFDALGEDPAAAQDVLTDDDLHADTDLLHWLYDGRTAQGNFYTWGSTLGEALEAGTSFVGAGEQGTRNHASAEIVADLVDFYGTRPDRFPLTMDESMVNILTRHVQAVNYAGSGAEGSVAGNNPDGLLEYQRIAMANLDRGELNTLLSQIFGTDYYVQHGEHAEPERGYPRYQELAIAQQAAFRRDFLEVAATHPLDQGRLEQVALQQGLAQNDTALALRDALVAAGAGRDQANADARAAVDFVLGLGIDKLPIDKLGGVGGTVGGLAIDGVKSAFLDAAFPDRDHAGQADSEGQDVQDYLRQTTPLQYVSLLDQAGLLTGDASPAAWARAHPDAASFVEDGQMVNLADLYAHRSERTEEWNDFLFYYQEHGQSALNELDLNEQFSLGFLTSDDVHSGRGGG
ncbi:MAG: hypothetical protein ACRC35_04280 [Angustibacter sp.]